MTDTPTRTVDEIFNEVYDKFQAYFGPKVEGTDLGIQLKALQWMPWVGKNGFIKSVLIPRVDAIGCDAAIQEFLAKFKVQLDATDTAKLKEYVEVFIRLSNLIASHLAKVKK